MKNTTLIVSFDANQNSSNLNWKFSRAGTIVPMGSHTHAGAYVFQSGDTLGVQITASQSNFANITLVDCHLIHMPLRNPRDTPDASQIGLYPAASPFFMPNDRIFGSAVINLPASAFSITPVLNGVQNWNLNRQMQFQQPGAWEMSFIMTVKISTSTGAIYRVFGFDPEVQVTPGL